MPAVGPGGVWDEAASAATSGTVGRFEADWREAPPRRRPDPLLYLPDSNDPEIRAGTRLALLRTEMALLWEAGEPVPAESYRLRYPELDSDALVALAYEEFCLREEAGQGPEAADFLRRYADVAPALRRVLDIHGLVGSGATATFAGPPAPEVAFPEAGQTIGGFRLVAELGRGSFARVFRAEERQLADRPVALKVARTGSREPQTLARLQHTHIVPVHSYRIDPATGLHLLCMPYLGGVTLARLLADPQVASARSGMDLLRAIDRLDPSGTPPRPSAAREALADRNYARAVAWWGARLAEALAHAHERGVLHRDVKPSNVLVTSDGLPLLLDFNLAWETRPGDAADGERPPGGTLAYMAPEHLEALARGRASGLDARSDLYSLGVVLYEAMGSRPFDPPERPESVGALLGRLAESRRAGPPGLRARHPHVPPEYEAVVARCLAPEPADRYATAAELAADLQAIADDGPLRHAREPLPSRAWRWARRHRTRLAVAAPVVVLAAVLLGGLFLVRLMRERRVSEVRELLARGIAFYDNDDVARAEAQFDLAARLAGRRLGSDVPPAEAGPPRLAVGLEELRALARSQQHLATEKRTARDEADELADRAEKLRLRLMWFTGPIDDPSEDLRATLAPFFVLRSPDWTGRAELGLLDGKRRERLRADVDDLLFLWALVAERLAGRAETGSEERARLVEEGLTACTIGLRGGVRPGPWLSLRGRLEARRDGVAPRDPPADDDPRGEGSAQACFYWGLLRAREGAAADSIAWLERACYLRPDDYWAHFYLGYQYQHARPPALDQALAHYQAAVALEPERAWTWFNLAQLHGDLGAWRHALDSLNAALEHAGKTPAAVPIRLNLGLTRMAIGAFPAARAEFREVQAATTDDDPLNRAARVNLARLDAESGRSGRALATYDALLTADPGDAEARTGRAVLMLRTGHFDSAEADLTALLGRGPASAALHALRAEARLALDRPEEALADARQAQRLAPRPAHGRLALRAALAAGRLTGPLPDDPTELSRLPGAGAGLARDLLRAADRIAARAEAGDASAALDRAVLLAAGGDLAAAEGQAGRVAGRPGAPARARLVRAYVRRGRGHLAAALEDVALGLRIDPGDARLLALRGRLRLDEGDAEAALADLEGARRLGVGPAALRPRAEALAALRRHREAVEAWTAALEADPDDSGAYLGRASALIRLSRWDAALADLERALARSPDDLATRARAILVYALCIPERPDRLARLAGLVAGPPR